jgi:hypothetical protein
LVGKASGSLIQAIGSFLATVGCRYRSKYCQEHCQFRGFHHTSYWLISCDLLPEVKLKGFLLLLLREKSSLKLMCFTNVRKLL